MRIHPLLAAGLSLVFSGAFGATQGTLGATSQGSFTNTFNATAPPQVQILGLSDALVTPATGTVAQYEGASDHPDVYGTADRFCVVNTGGGAVTLTAVSDQYGPADQTPMATAAGGSVLEYTLSMHLVGDHTVGNSFTASAPSWTVPAGATVTSAGACGAGNVRKLVYHQAIDGEVVKLLPLPANGNVYVGTITLTATPE
jgi:hypothetical protein